MRWVVWVVFVAACGRLEFRALPQVDGSIGDASTAALSCASSACPAQSLCASDQLCHPILFQDSFDTGSIDPQWSLLRFEFDINANGQLETLPTTRPGFNYGQGGNGRSAVAALHVGDPTWTDLRVEWTQQSEASLLIVDASLPACEHTPSMLFRLQSYSESWNAPENTLYNFAIDQGCSGPIGPTGSWGLGESWQYWIPGQGWSPVADGYGSSLGTAQTPVITDTPTRFAVEVRGTTMQVWIDGVLILTYDDSTHVYANGESPILYGGVGFSTAWEQMFWIDDVVVADLTR